MQFELELNFLIYTIRKGGCRISFVSDLDRPGKIYPLKKVILIRSGLTPRRNIAVLVHEFGHWLHFLKVGARWVDLPQRERETKAYLYGWGVISGLNLTIEKTDWCKIHQYITGK